MTDLEVGGHINSSPVGTCAQWTRQKVEKRGRDRGGQRAAGCTLGVGRLVLPGQALVAQPLLLVCALPVIPFPAPRQLEYVSVPSGALSLILP